MLVCAGKCNLYPRTAVNAVTAIVPLLTARSFDGTILIVKADKVGASWASRTTILFPIQVLQPTLVKFKHLHWKKWYIGFQSIILYINLFKINSDDAIISKHSYQSKAGHNVWVVCNKCRDWPCSIFSTSKCNHIALTTTLYKEGTKVKWNLELYGSG